MCVLNERKKSNVAALLKWKQGKVQNPKADTILLGLSASLACNCDVITEKVYSFVSNIQSGGS